VKTKTLLQIYKKNYLDNSDVISCQCHY